MYLADICASPWIAEETQQLAGVTEQLEAVTADTPTSPSENNPASWQLSLYSCQQYPKKANLTVGISYFQTLIISVSSLVSWLAEKAAKTWQLFLLTCSQVLG